MALRRTAPGLLRGSDNPKRLKRDAYNHAERGEYCTEIDTRAKIDRWGVEAITGRRQFYFGELRRMIAAENIVTAYKSRAHAENWVAWARDNSVLASLLVDAEKIANG